VPESDRYVQRRDAGVCVKCGANAARPSRVDCRACADAEALRASALRAERRSLGLCPWCGKRKPVKQREHCAPCLARGRKNNAAYRDRG
jgi:hypothetical protein